MCLPLNIIGKLSESGWRLDQDTGQPGPAGGCRDAGPGLREENNNTNNRIYRLTQYITLPTRYLSVLYTGKYDIYKISSAATAPPPTRGAGTIYMKDSSNQNIMELLNTHRIYCIQIRQSLFLLHVKFHSAQ